MKIVYVAASVLGGIMAFAWLVTEIAKDMPAPSVEKNYIGHGIKKVEIDNKHVCFVLHEYHGISCVQKVGE